MRWTIRITLLLAALLLAYTAWPFITIYQLGDAVERRDTRRVEELIDFPSVRRSIAAQVVERYMKVTGRASSLGQLGAAATNVGASIAEPEIAKIVTPEGLIELLRGGQVAGAPAGLPTTIAPTQVRSNEVFRVWLDSDYGARRVIFLLPPNVPRAEQFALRFELNGLAWRVREVVLPEVLAARLAAEVAKRNPQ